MAASNLYASLNNMDSQLKIERMPSLTKDTITKALEDVVIKLGYDPSDIKEVEDMIKNKNDDIQALRKKFKLPTTEHP